MICTEHGELQSIKIITKHERTVLFKIDQDQGKREFSKQKHQVKSNAKQLALIMMTMITFIQET